MELSEIFIIIFLVYSILIIRFYRNLLIRCKRLYDRDFKELPESYEPFIRYDYKNWNHFEIYFGAVFLLPLRITLVIASLLSCYISLWVGSIGVPLEQEWPQSRYNIVRFFAKSSAKGFIYFSGFFPIKKIIVQYTQFDPQYKQSEQDRLGKTSLIVSNHQALYDTIFLVSEYMPSFISKEVVAHYPIFSGITIALKSIFVDRENRQNKDSVLEKMMKRKQLIEQGRLYPPILIFPEGTTSNGKYLISFKKGAFESLKPIKIVCLKYYDRNFNLSMDKLDLLDLLCLSMVQLYNKLEFYEFEGLFNPNYLNLQKYPEEQRWEVYAEKVKDIMAKCLDKKKSEYGYRHFNEYYKLKETKQN